MAGKRKISLVLADVDGTLVTEEKILTKGAHDAVNALHEAGIRFAITSGRPPLGMAMLFDVLDIETPIAGFNGGLFVKRDLSILEQKTVPADVAHRAIVGIAMGNASDEVKAQAAAVTASYNDERFAKAMEAFILGSARQ
jgi:HAD superfamily hydrolase (TIGR01484 family)